MIRLYTSNPLAPGATLHATDAQAHYLGAVMRRAAGEELLLFNGLHGEWRARIETLRKTTAILTPLRQTRAQSAEPDLWLAFAPLKRDTTDLVVQKATELGAAALLPVFTAHTNAARINPDRLNAIAIEAAEQSERLTIPRIAAPVDLQALLAGWPANRPLAAAIERGPPGPIPAAAALLVGPEGGFSPQELDALRAARFISPLSLGPRILRAETAAIAGLALLQAARWSTT